MTVKEIPERLNDFRVYVDGNNSSPAFSDIELPELKALTETVSGAGILGEYESPTIGQFESMKIKLNWKSISKELIDLLKIGSHKIDCRLANQVYDIKSSTHKISADRVLVHGPVISNNFGKGEKNSPYEGSTEVEVMYIKIEKDKKVLLELDKVNFIFKVNGVDQLKEMRKALGM